MLKPLVNASLSPSLYTAAIVIPTVLRPSLARAVRSVFDQDVDGTLQILIGIDVIEGDRAILDHLSGICPPHIRIDVLEPGYSTAFKRGGLYPARAGGVLRTVLSYLAHSPYIAYLDDDNWWAPAHLSSLLAAIKEVDWAFSHRWFVEWETGEPIAVDRWESVGIEAGVFAEQLGGFVDTSTLMLNKLACHDVLPNWSRAAYPDGSGEDRLVFDALKTRSRGETGQATSFYLAKPDDAMAINRLQLFRENGITLPSQRQAGVISLANALAPLRAARLAEPRNAVTRGPVKSEEGDMLLTALVERLKPQEIVSIAAGQSALAADLADLCQAAGLNPLIAVFDAPPELAGSADLLSLIDPPAGIGCFIGTNLAVDLVHLARVPLWELDDCLNQMWRLVRRGGIVLGEGEAAAGSPLGLFLAEFAASNHAELLPASMQGHHRWILQKGSALG